MTKSTQRIVGEKLASRKKGPTEIKKRGGDSNLHHEGFWQGYKGSKNRKELGASLKLGISNRHTESM